MTTTYAPSPTRTRSVISFDPDQCSPMPTCSGVSRCEDPDDDDEDDDDGGGKLTLTKEQLNRRLRRAKRKAAKDAEAEARAALLEDLGVESEDELKQKLQAKPEPKPDKDPDDEDGPAFDPDAFKSEVLSGVKETVKGFFSEREQRQQEEQSKRQQREQLQAAAKRAGIGDTSLSMAMTLASSHIGGLDEEDREEFDPEKYFTGLVKQHPTLKGVEEEPADTGGNGNDRPKPPKPGEKPDGFDASTATREERAARLAELRSKAASAG